VHRRLAIALLLGTVLLPSLKAQTRGAAGPGRGLTISFGPPPQTPPTPQPFLGFPYFYPEYTPSVAAPAPQIVVVPAPAAKPEPPEPVKQEPLLIEWQGNRYVRISGGIDTSASRQSTEMDYSEAFSRKAALAPVPDLAPVLLIFRDGRKDEVRGYTIADGVMYTGADYWTSGQWTRKIMLADLDMPSTLRVNQKRGVKFLLPVGPNEVVTRP